ncbi:ParA family protein [Novosphingobium sp.]|uniref:ParA family protein n=1 Tax=Novosphingobium sp. TaxID=1874826 RepID=UPI00286D8B16|nr:ParA family protein [Novosphingobium sp.]
MAVVGVFSAKGGVGKTTLAVDLAWRSAMRGGFRTLLWDLDQQGGSAFLLGIDDRPRAHAASVFQRDGRPRDLIEQTPYPGLDLLKADTSLRSLSVSLARIGQKRRLAQLSGQLASSYDRIVLDCPPTLNEVSEQVVNAADVLIVPLRASPMALRTLDSVRREIAALHGRHPPILPVLSMYNAQRPNQRALRASDMFGWPVIPMANQVETAAAERRPVGAGAGGSRVDMALDRLWAGIEAKLAERTDFVPSEKVPVPA